jgi:hypothetical protein
MHEKKFKGDIMDSKLKKIKEDFIHSMDDAMEYIYERPEEDEYNDDWEPAEETYKEVELEVAKEFHNLPEELKNDPSFLLEALEHEAWLISKLIPKALSKDKEFFYQAVEFDEEVLLCADPSLLADKDFLLEVISRCGDSEDFTKSPLAYASKELKNDRNVVLAAVKKDEKALEYASDELQNDPEVIDAAKM